MLTRSTLARGDFCPSSRPTKRDSLRTKLRFASYALRLARNSRARSGQNFASRNLEARVGIEPTHKGFADLSLTSWVPRLESQSIPKLFALVCCASAQSRAERSAQLPVRAAGISWPGVAHLSFSYLSRANEGRKSRGTADSTTVPLPQQARSLQCFTCRNKPVARSSTAAGPRQRQPCWRRRKSAERGTLRFLKTPN